jgi:hypothetical protein
MLACHIVQPVRSSHLAIEGGTRFRRALADTRHLRLSATLLRSDSFVIGGISHLPVFASYKGVRPEDIGKIFGLQGKNQVIIDHINRFVEIGMLPEELGLPPFTYEEMCNKGLERVEAYNTGVKQSCC